MRGAIVFTFKIIPAANYGFDSSRVDVYCRECSLWRFFAGRIYCLCESDLFIQPGSTFLYGFGCPSLKMNVKRRRYTQPSIVDNFRAVAFLKILDYLIQEVAAASGSLPRTQIQLYFKGIVRFLPGNIAYCNHASQYITLALFRPVHLPVRIVSTG